MNEWKMASDYYRDVQTLSRRLETSAFVSELSLQIGSRPDLRYMMSLEPAFERHMGDTQDTRTVGKHLESLQHHQPCHAV